jgi:cytochrome P450
MQHTDPSIFPRPVDFLPERWLPENVTPAMYHNFVPFAKGSRICLGMKYVYPRLVLIAKLRESGFANAGMQFGLCGNEPHVSSAFS